jgi:hypothetical protein
MAAPSRIEVARRRLQVARYSIGAIALSAFGAFAFAVRDAHPATHTGTTSASSIATTTTDASTTFGGSASISPAPQAAAPQVESSGS